MRANRKLVVLIAAVSLLSTACADIDFLRAVDSGLRQYNDSMSSLYSTSQYGGGSYRNPSSDDYDDDAPTPSYQPTYSTRIPSSTHGRPNTQPIPAEDCGRLTGVYRTACECRLGRGAWAGAKACPAP